MLMSSDVHDQAYQFFIEEAPELLQVIETELLTLRSERSPTKIHELMRAAHSIKGGAAFARLEGIVTIAHRLEDIFRALYSETVEIDVDLEGLLLQAYDCLRLPLMEQIETRSFNSASALTAADLIFTQIEERLGDALTQIDYYIPSSGDLNVDIVLSIFETDIKQGLERLTTIVADSKNDQIFRELRTQAEVFGRLAEFLNLPGFGTIAQTTLVALETCPDQVLHIAQLALADFKAGKDAVLAGDRTHGGNPSPDLIALAAIPVIDEAPAAIFNPAIAFLNPETEDEASAAIFNPAIAFLNPETGVEQSEDPPLCLEELLSGEQSVTAADTSDNSPVFLLETNIADAFLTVADVPIAETENDAPTTTTELNLSSTLSSAIVVSQTTGFSSIQPVPKQESPQTLQLAQEPLSVKIRQRSASTSATPTISVRVDLARLERMNNLLGELTINRNTFALENEQAQEAIQELFHRFSRFREITEQVQNLSNVMLVASERPDYVKRTTFSNFSVAKFDSLEMDRYGSVHTLLQGILEEVAQLEEAVNDVALFTGRSKRIMRQEHQMLSQLRDQLMWSRMLPIGEVLNRFPRVLRDLSTAYHKPVSLKLTGTEVQVEKAILEKLYDPLLHLLRNAFDHGIEPPNVRFQRGKPEQGEIEIRAYHQSNQTVIEVRDDGQGLNLERICSRALERGLLSPEHLAASSAARLFELIFEPGFSTASQVSELSGRGVGLDVVRAQLQSLKGSVTVTSSPGQGSTFTLRLPFTLTIAKLLICSVGSTTVALPIDNITKILSQADPTYRADNRSFLTWQDQSIPIYRLVDLLGYNCPLPEAFDVAVSVSSAENKTPSLLIMHREQEVFAIEVDHLIAERELVIKPFGSIIIPPNYVSGCTILGNGILIPVINGAILLEAFLAPNQSTLAIAPFAKLLAPDKPLFASEGIISNTTHAISTVLIIDDSATARQALVFTLQKAGYRVLQAHDGWEAIEQLQGNSVVQLIICDLEMPNMNGFEFLDYRRQDPQLAKIPVAMLTTRSNSKHHDLAMHLGANVYFTKPYIELELLSAIETLLNSNVPHNLPNQ
ncbi:MAG: hybrid sensor histidine kinase/response regulator [Cyanobacteria bacterium CRU_2_1]|nr:hybrid sensor histidine kinase/response regulator [Cyanobacteria bacterium RU_5_0]NJR62095.1 hybrid sensor histidine kinase/response regulator [Cyanobacteria bacterium CRU_2_1]